MAVSYKKLWKLLIDRDMTKTMLRKEAGITTAALAKLGKNENVNTEVTNYKKSRENRKIFIWSKKGAENQALFRGLQKKLIMGQRTRSGL